MTKPKRTEIKGSYNIQYTNEQGEKYHGYRSFDKTIHYKDGKIDSKSRSDLGKILAELNKDIANSGRAPKFDKDARITINLEFDSGPDSFSSFAITSKNDLRQIVKFINENVDPQQTNSHTLITPLLAHYKSQQQQPQAAALSENTVVAK